MVFLLFFYLFSANTELRERDLYYLIPRYQPELILDTSDSSYYIDGTEYEWSLFDWPGKNYGLPAPKVFNSMPGEACITLKTGNLKEGLYRLSVDYNNKEYNLCEVYLHVVSDQMGELLSSSDRALMNKFHWPLKKFFSWLNGRIRLFQAFAIYYHCFQDWTVSDSVYLSIFYQRTWSESFHLNVSHYKDATIMRRRIALFTRHSAADVCDPFKNYCPADQKTFDERLIEYFEWNDNNPYLCIVKAVLTLFSWLGFPFIFIGSWINRFISILQ